MKTGLFEWAANLAQRVGPVFGLVMGLCYAGAYAGYWWEDHSGGNFAQVCFGLGFGVFALAIGRSQKKATDIYVASEAEKRIENPALSNTSDVPQIQREIESQQAKSAGV